MVLSSLIIRVLISYNKVNLIETFSHGIIRYALIFFFHLMRVATPYPFEIVLANQKGVELLFRTAILAGHAIAILVLMVAKKTLSTAGR